MIIMCFQTLFYMNWKLHIKKLPVFFMIAMGLAMGSVLASFNPIDLGTTVVLSFLFCSAAYFSKIELRTVLLSLISLSIAWYSSSTNNNDAAWYNQNKEQIQAQKLYGDVVSIDIEKEKTIYLMRLQRAGNILAQNSFVRVFVDRTCACPLELGQQIMLDSHKVYPFSKAAKIKAFNAQAYFHNQSIHFQAFPSCAELVPLSKRTIAQKPNVKDKIQNWLKHKIDHSSKHAKVKAMVKGLFLGKVKEMDRTELKNYRAAGIGYLFAVSGMHVGLMFMLLQFFFRYFNLFRKGSYVAFIGTFLCLFLFVVGADLTCSSLRAFGMLFIYELARINGYAVNKWNVLGFVATLNLLFNPNDIWNIGFQLSYLAIVGIFLFYNSILKYLNFLKMGRYLSSLIAISLAVQIVVAPVSIYYFETFSPYFFISSLWAGILSYVFIILSLVQFLIHSINITSINMDYLLLFMSQLMQQGVNFTLEMPMAKLSFDFDLWDCSLYYFYLIIGVNWYRFGISTVGILICMSLAVSGELVHSYLASQKDILEIYIPIEKSSNSYILKNKNGIDSIAAPLAAVSLGDRQIQIIQQQAEHLQAADVYLVERGFMIKNQLECLIEMRPKEMVLGFCSRLDLLQEIKHACISNGITFRYADGHILYQLKN